MDETSLLWRRFFVAAIAFRCIWISLLPLQHCKIREDRYTVVMIIEKFPDVQRLSASEKLIFVSELWNDLEAHPSDLPVSPEVISELDRRMEHFRQHPNEFTTWEAVKERVLGQLP
jgi:putative addiction module component (TIGR02574 family)